MPGVTEVLYCFVCQAHTIIEQVDAPPESVTECVHGHQDTLGAVQTAMQRANKKPKTEANLF